MPLSPTYAHDVVLNASPRPSFKAPSSEKLPLLITTKPPPAESSHRPPSPCYSDADEQTLVDDLESRPLISTPITPIQPNPIRRPPAAKRSRHARRADTMYPNCLMNTFTTAYCVFIIMGLGSAFGLSNISLGCLTRKPSMDTCKALGAAGGAFASIPTILTIFLTWYIHKTLHNLNYSLLSWISSISVVFVIFPLICFGFTFLSAFIGWHILNTLGSVDFDLHRAYVFAAIGSACTFILYSLVFGLVIINVDDD